jgi:hypothetical protein
MVAVNTSIVVGAGAGDNFENLPFSTLAIYNNDGFNGEALQHHYNPMMNKSLLNLYLHTIKMYL